MTQSYFNEMMNGHLAVFAMWASFIFMRYVWANVHLGYWELRPALAVLALVISDVFIRVPFWVSRHYINVHLPSKPPSWEIEWWFYAIITFGVLWSCTAALCVIRVFAPDSQMRCIVTWSVISSIVLVEGWMLLGYYFGV